MQILVAPDPRLILRSTLLHSILIARWAVIYTELFLAISLELTLSPSCRTRPFAWMIMHRYHMQNISLFVCCKHLLRMLAAPQKIRQCSQYARTVYFEGFDILSTSSALVWYTFYICFGSL